MIVSYAIRAVGDPVLRQKAEPVPQHDITSKRIQEFIEIMRQKLQEAPGVGLAAPQIGEPIQIVVIEDRQAFIRNLTLEQIAERQRAPIPFHVLINPRVISKGSRRARFFEGCLSLAGFRALVPRADTVAVEALDQHGNELAFEAQGWYARILQHEYDHLQGILYIDAMEPHTFTTQENYEDNWKQVGKATDQALASLKLLGVDNEPYYIEGAIPTLSGSLKQRYADAARSFADIIKQQIRVRAAEGHREINEADIDTWLSDFLARLGVE